jgi:methionyl-tRNA formyltransferase
MLNKKKISLTKIILLKDRKEKLLNKQIIRLIKKNNNNPKIKTFFIKNINNKKVTKFIKKQKEKLIIISLYPGSNGIVKNKELLKRKKLLHSHPGKLPEYRGSTTIYYSLLKEKKIWCDSFFLNNKIDQGKVIYSKQYPIPKNIYSIEKKYDSKIRSQNLIESLNVLKKKLIFQKNKKYFKEIISNYYIIHPILRFITFKKFKNV